MFSFALRWPAVAQGKSLSILIKSFNQIPVTVVIKSAFGQSKRICPNDWVIQGFEGDNLVNFGFRTEVIEKEPSVYDDDIYGEYDNKTYSDPGSDEFARLGCVD